MAVQTQDLWDLVRGRPQIDPRRLAEAVQDRVRRQPLDYRTRLLVRDSVEALKEHWGEGPWRDWLERCPVRVEIEAVCREDFERPGFPSLPRRLMKATEPEELVDFLRELGLGVPRPVRLCVGGSAALILLGHLYRHTDDVAVVDEVPAEVRSLHPLLANLQERYGLGLTHFPSHYLPAGWEQRAHSLGRFGQMQVYLVDVHDIFLSKLFSPRTKDRDDLRMLRSLLDREFLVSRLRETAAPLSSDPTLRPRAEQNWYILHGEALPT